jgi:hypothetical protein
MGLDEEAQVIWRERHAEPAFAGGLCSDSDSQSASTSEASLRSTVRYTSFAVSEGGFFGSPVLPSIHLLFVVRAEASKMSVYLLSQLEL